MERLNQVEEIARDVLSKFPSERTYHNVEHVEQTVKMARTLGEARGLDDDELELLLTAAWFHDLGYHNGPASGHEERSVELVESRLSELFTADEREQIATAIYATEWPQSPSTELGKILADADVHTLGTSSASKARERVFEELQQTEYPDLEWDEYINIRIEMFDAYTFHTPEARERFQSQKDSNIDELKVESDE